MGKKSRGKQEDEQVAEEVVGQESGLAKFLKWIIFIGTAVITFTPFVISGNYFFPFVGVKSLFFMALVEIILAAWIILLSFSKKYRPRFNALLIALGLFLLVQILSSVFGVDFSRSFWSKFERMSGILMQLHLFTFFLVISSVLKRKEDWLKIFGISVAGALVMSLINYSSTFGLNFLGNLNSAARGGATLGNSSFLGTYLLFNFFFSLYLIFHFRGAMKIVSIIVAFLLIFSLYFSTARAAFLSVITGTILLFVLWLAFARIGKLKILGLSLLFLIIIGGSVTTFLTIKPGTYFHTHIMDKYLGETFGGRIPVWNSAWQGFLAKPVFGWGPENFEVVFTRYFNPCFLGPNCGGDVWYDRAHNIVFDTLATIGAVGMISYFSIFASAFYILWRKFFQKNIGFWAAGIFSVTMVAYFIQNLTVFDMVNSYMLFFLLLGFIGCIAQEKDESKEKENRVNYFIVFAVIILFMVSFLKFVIQPANEDKDIIKTLNLSIGSQQRIDSYQKTLSDSPLGKYQVRDFFAESLMGASQDPQFSQLPKESMKKEFDFIAVELEKSTSENPLDFRAWLKLGQLYNIYAILINDSSKLNNADNDLNNSLKVSPTNQQGYWALAQTKLYEGKSQDAFALAEQALALEPKSKQSNLIVIQIAMIMGNKALAQQKAAEALKIDPSWATDTNNIIGL
jgi:O-antigen ligase